MPPSTDTPIEPRRARLRERRVRGAFILYDQISVGAEGQTVRRDTRARRGEVALLRADQEIRFDSLGLLCPVGQTVAELEAESEERYRLYAAERSGAPSAGTQVI